jgi:hypothetical protein
MDKVKLKEQFTSIPCLSCSAQALWKWIPVSTLSAYKERIGVIIAKQEKEVLMPHVKLCLIWILCELPKANKSHV